MNPLIVDYFEPKRVFVEHLRNKIPELKAVYTPSTLEDALEASQNTPCVHILYRGDAVLPQDAGRKVVKVVDQEWLFVLAVRHGQAQLHDTTTLTDQAGIIIPKLLDSLQGFSPTNWMAPLNRVSSMPAGYTSAFAYYPFTFSGRVIT